MDPRLFTSSLEYVNAHHQELLQFAQRERLIRQSIGGSQPVASISHNLYQKALLRFSQQLIDWGTSLQGRYLSRADLPAPMVYNETNTIGK